MYLERGQAEKPTLFEACGWAENRPALWRSTDLASKVPPQEILNRNFCSLFIFFPREFQHIFLPPWTLHTKGSFMSDLVSVHVLLPWLCETHCCIDRVSELFMAAAASAW
jgi:hypothetical protein